MNKRQQGHQLRAGAHQRFNSFRPRPRKWKVAVESIARSSPLAPNSFPSPMARRLDPQRATVRRILAETRSLRRTSDLSRQRRYRRHHPRLPRSRRPPHRGVARRPAAASASATPHPGGYLNSAVGRRPNRIPTSVSVSACAKAPHQPHRRGRHRYARGQGRQQRHARHHAILLR